MLKVQVDKLHTLTGHNQSVYTLQPSSKSGIVFSAAGDGMVVMWDLGQPESGRLIARLSNSIYALHFHEPSGMLIAGHNYDGIHLLDPTERKEVGSLKLTSAAIFDIQSLGHFLFVAVGDGTLIKVDCRSLAIVGARQLSPKSARCIAVNAHTGEVAVGYSDHFIRVFSADDLSMIHEWKAHQNSVFTLQYDPGGSRLFSGSRDARLKAWNAQSDYALDQEVIAHLYAINHLDFSPDGKHFVTCSMDRSVKVWETEDVRLLKVIDRSRHAGHGTSVNKVLWTSYHNQLLSASDDRTISVWNINFENDLL